MNYTLTLSDGLGDNHSITLSYGKNSAEFSVSTHVTASIVDILPAENPGNHMASATRLERAIKKRPENFDTIKAKMSELGQEDYFELLMSSGFHHMLVMPPENPEQMAWYQEFVSRIESHPRNNRTRGLITNLSDDPILASNQIEKYGADYTDFYDHEKLCIARIALMTGPLFLSFGKHDRHRFNTFVGLLNEEELDKTKPNSMFLYSMDT